MNLGDTEVASNFNFLRSAVAHLRHGGLCIYPTETAYALGCDATNARAVRAIFRLKGRQRRKPLPLIVASRAMAERYAHFTPLARRFARQWWPGPLTIVAANRFTRAISPPLSEGEREGVRTQVRGEWGILAPGVATRDGSIALRISSHPIARALSRALGRPVVSTSANRSGQPPCYSVRSALHSFAGSSGTFTHSTPTIQKPSTYLFCGRRKDMLSPNQGSRLRQEDGIALAVFDIGQLPRHRPSTIVDARGGYPIVLRHGAIRME